MAASDACMHLPDLPEGLFVCDILSYAFDAFAFHVRLTSLPLYLAVHVPPPFLALLSLRLASIVLIISLPTFVASATLGLKYFCMRSNFSR